jgi:Fic family protein
MCKFINDDLKSPSEEYAIGFGILRAIVAHVYFAWIHPFGDGNGRTARLIEFQLLLGAGVPAVSAHLLSNHYNKTRSEYYRFLELAQRSVLIFAEYAIQGFVDMLDQQIRRIRRHQYAVTWKDLVYEKFKGQKTSAAHRQRLLALAIGARKKGIPVAELRTLTPELALEYATKTPKTIARDVNTLTEQKLILRLPGRKVLANRLILQGFLPGRRHKEKWI